MEVIVQRSCIRTNCYEQVDTHMYVHTRRAHRYTRTPTYTQLSRIAGEKRRKMELLHPPTRESASKFPQTPATVYLEFLEHEENVRWKTTLFDVRPLSTSRNCVTTGDGTTYPQHEKKRVIICKRTALSCAPANRYCDSGIDLIFFNFTYQRLRQKQSDNYSQADAWK